MLSSNRHILSGIVLVVLMIDLVLFQQVLAYKHPSPHQSDASDKNITHETDIVHFSCPYTTAEYPPRQTINRSLIKAKAVNISHHLLARDMIADTLNRISPDYKTVIIIGPNHRELGADSAVTSWSKWHTPFGVIEPDSVLLHQLVSNNIVRVHEDIFTVEHSVCGLVSFVKRYFPGATVVPIVLKANSPSEKNQQLGTYLSQTCTDCLLITSVDFSHNVSVEQASVNDIRSSRILTKLEKDHIDQIVADSRPTLETLMYYLKDQNVSSGELIHMSDSNKVSNQNLPTVTSYLTIIYQ